jgi:hypothetical protein
MTDHNVFALSNAEVVGSNTIRCMDICVTIYVCDYRRDMDWGMDILTTYTHDS